jgi:hypothetical protein
LGFFGIKRQVNLLLVMPLLAFLPPHAAAQNVSVVRANSIEVGPFVGLTYGLDAIRVLEGGNVTYAVTSRILPYIEYSYFPGLVRSFNVPGFSGNTRVPFSDIHAGVHIRFPIHESPLVPYAVAGIGALIYPERTLTFQPNSSGFAPNPIPIPGTSDLAVNFGGGLRYYFGQRWGARLEGKVYKPTGEYTGVFGKVEVGIFYQFR